MLVPVDFLTQAFNWSKNVILAESQVDVVLYYVLKTVIYRFHWNSYSQKPSSNSPTLINPKPIPQNHNLVPIHRYRFPKTIFIKMDFIPRLAQLNLTIFGESVWVNQKDNLFRGKRFLVNWNFIEIDLFLPWKRTKVLIIFLLLIT